MDLDSYKTICTPTENVLFKEKNSKFFGFSFPIANEEDVKVHLEGVKKIHHTARHFCYAYQLGEATFKYRVNDDGEPSHSAGMPIFGQIQSYEVTNILIVVVRYFGGIKLGVGGLISAYKSTAQRTLESSEIIQKTIDVFFKLNFEYDMMNKVVRIIKEKNIKLEHQKMELDCEFVIAIRKKNSQDVFDCFHNLYKVDIKRLET